MARTVRDATLESRTARARLKARHRPYWRTIERGLHLGYRKGSRGGIWRARFYAGAGDYRETVLGRADDVLDADGVAALSYSHAQAKARAWFVEQTRIAAGLEPQPAGPYTVADAMRDYLAWFKDHRKSIRQTSEAAERCIVPSLGEHEVAKLTPQVVKRWHEGLAIAPARVRSRKGRPPKHRKAAADDDAKRKRRATANRNLTVLKAALNHAWREGRVANDTAWRKVAPFRAVEAPVVRYLTEAECVRLVNAAAPDFRPLVRAALLTGCRYGELTTLRAADFNQDAGRLLIRTSKAGKPRHVVLTDEGRVFFATISAGKAGTDLMFTRPDGGKWGASHQQRPILKACKRAKIAPVSFHVLRHTHGSLLAMKGVPMAVIAQQLGHADTRMTEKHYAHVSPSYVADTIRANFPALGIVETGNLRALR